MLEASLQTMIPLGYALVLGGLVGFERELSGRPAGLRTHILVCLCSTMLILISREVNLSLPSGGAGGTLVVDPNRMGAGIVTGIGFLGAATVLRSGDFLRGLTTAACIWYVAGLGIVLGKGDYTVAVAATTIVLIVLTFGNKLTKIITPVIYRRLIVISSRSDAEQMVSEVREVLDDEKVRVLDIASGHDNETAHNELVLYVSLKNRFQSPRLTERVAKIDGVASARWTLITIPR